MDVFFLVNLDDILASGDWPFFHAGRSILGRQAMLVHVSPYLADKDVARLFDSINGSLELTATETRRRLGK